MADTTKIQWCDSTVNPIMGCGGFELFPTAREVLEAIAKAMNDAGVVPTTGSEDIKAIFKKLVAEVFLKSENPHPGHKNTVNVTNIWHLKDRFCDHVEESYGRMASQAAEIAIKKAVTCYAATLHLNKGTNIRDREGIWEKRTKPRKPHVGHAPIFEAVTQFAGRSMETAELPDLLGCHNEKVPWKDRLPRMIFVSDMGDALRLGSSIFGF